LKEFWLPPDQKEAPKCLGGWLACRRPSGGAFLTHQNLAKETSNMQKIEAIVRHHKLEEIKNALVKEGFNGMTVSEVRGFGRQKGQKEMFRGAEYNVDFVPKVKIELAIDDADTQKAVDIILRLARSEKIGDGKIFITDLREAIRIRTGERGAEAL
jgi:nitrogen regulatory protein P-II 1